MNQKRSQWDRFLKTESSGEMILHADQYLIPIRTDGIRGSGTVGEQRINPEE